LGVSIYSGIDKLFSDKPYTFDEVELWLEDALVGLYN